MKMTYRKLTSDERLALESNGCRCDNWDAVEVADPFCPAHYRNATFVGDIRLGTTGGTIMRNGNIPMSPGVYDAFLHNCVVGDDVLINRIGNFISGYTIGNRAVIENTACITMEGTSSFGNGVEVSVLNETGGREVPIYDCLSAHVAYIIAMYRHDKKLVNNLRAMIDRYVDSRRSDRGFIGNDVSVINTGTITNVYIGEATTINGAKSLRNGTVVSEAADPVYIGPNVMAKDFIMLAGAKVDEGAVLLHTFVGQATELTRLFSAHDSLFFANCACENGESAAIFAGPYTVTMHKSSLLIAGMFSFLNAGSGSNQSNHMYKLGPIHQGVVDRGSKTTSDSYVLWPAHIGAFSLVMGRHVSHPDTSRLPFSYLIETAGIPHLVPGVNLKSVGTIRDAMKWPKRDKRRTPNRLDFINFNLLSPYTVQKMMDGTELLSNIEATAGETSERYSYQGMEIKASALRKGRMYYGMAIDKFMGNSVLKRLEGDPIADEADMHRRLRTTTAAGGGEWFDLSGLIAPRTEIEALCNDIAEERIGSIQDVNNRMKALSDLYYEMEWTWVVENFSRWWGKEVSELTLDDVRAIAERWRNSVITLDKMLYDDARKEFSSVARIGFGLDAGNDNGRRRDFEQVRGEFERDPFVRMVLDHIESKTALYHDLISRLPE
ncbi:MAG: DUF4954 family protein [Bacteroidales bacterium]|nr:DUF4954 family protein [Bacteroidales bacterium]